MVEISIIVPAFNQERYVQQALDSAAAALATVPGEIIIVDDGSTDRTAAIASNWAASHQNVQLLRHEVNRGKLAALNTAARHLKGRLVVVLDADDTMDPNYLLRTREALTQTGADFVYTACRIVDADSQLLGFGRSMPFAEHLIEEYSFIPDCALTTAACFRSVLPLDEEVRVLPKHYRWQRICRLGFQGFYLEEHLFDYRMHDANMSGIGERITDSIQEGRLDHHLLTGYWDVREAKA